MEKLSLTQEWDKVFPKSNKVEHGKVTFHNRYGITLAADVYAPKNAASAGRHGRSSAGSSSTCACSGTSFHLTV